MVFKPAAAYLPIYNLKFCLLGKESSSVSFENTKNLSLPYGVSASRGQYTCSLFISVYATFSTFQ